MTRNRLSANDGVDPSDSVDRRVFLGVLVGAFLSACTNDSDSPASNATTSPATTTAAPITTTTTIPASSTVPPTTAATIQPLDTPPVEVPTDAFALGVASGEPDDTSVVVWTRLLGDLPAAFEMVWEVASDPELTLLVATGLVAVDADAAHSVRVIADGLDPDQRYFYRFRAGSLASPIGATRTMPTGDDSRAITLGVSSCQARTDGAWAAHRDLAASDVDVVLWLGDYIYGDHRTLDDQRAAYVEYRSDPLIQACHAAHPWISFIDDHEVANDFDASIDPARRGAALRAWWEHQPTRLPSPGADGSLTIYRSFELGGVARLIGLDVRQYASDDSLLGDAQWAFLDKAAGHVAPNTLIASPVIMSGLRDLDGEPLVPYSIDARPAERARLAALVATMPGPVIVSGDLHTSLVADFSADPLDAAAPSVAVEIMAPAISSAFPARFAALASLLPLVNPQLREVKVQNGWLELTLSDVGRSATFHYVDDVSDPASSISVRTVPDL